MALTVQGVQILVAHLGQAVRIANAMQHIYDMATDPIRMRNRKPETNQMLLDHLAKLSVEIEQDWAPIEALREAVETFSISVVRDEDALIVQEFVERYAPNIPMLMIYCGDFCLDIPGVSIRERIN